LEVESFGPIRRADIEFGDLTVLVGPQASGKSLFVQLYKAIKDAGAIRADLRSYGFDWLHGPNPVRDYCSVYFGGGLEGLVQPSTSLRGHAASIDFWRIVKPGGRAGREESVFLIPAQRVLVLQDGWPKPFMGYSTGDPYCMRRFGDTLRLLMEGGLGRAEAIFPQQKRLKAELKAALDDSIYVGAKLAVETEGARKLIVLAPPGQKAALPYSAWSAGQREFTPLLLGLYWLMPPSKVSRRADIHTVIIEEPEMGLHPGAILTFGLLVLDLLQRSYRVIVSTHSPVVLDLVWAIGQLQNVPGAGAAKALRKVFGLPRLSGQMSRVFQTALEKEYRAYFFEQRADGVVARDISSLDPGADDEVVAGWGGLSGFSGRIAEIVGQALVAEEAHATR
jgi:hypothetical protein